MRVTPIQRIVFSQRRQSQTWKQSDSQKEDTREKPNSKKHNKNKDLK
tara:strand:- start:225 stop:365 length:141 start_codon:yes stop_codon:yes gene_type:complete